MFGIYNTCQARAALCTYIYFSTEYQLIKADIALSRALYTGIHHRNFFCRLGILNRKYLESSSEFKFLTEWQKLGAASDVATTSVQAAMLEPVWNEDIKL